MLWPPKPYEHSVREKQKKRNLIKKEKKRKMETKRRENLGILKSYIHKIGISRKQNYLVKRE